MRHVRFLHRLRTFRPNSPWAAMKIRKIKMGSWGALLALIVAGCSGGFRAADLAEMDARDLSNPEAQIQANNATFQFTSASQAAAFYFKGTANGTTTITANLLNLVSASQNEIIGTPTPVPSPTPTPTPSLSVALPIKASDNKRYLVDQNNVPFVLTGDAPHSLIANLSPVDADSYFATRESQAFNAAWVEILCNTYIPGCRADGSTYDGLVPFTVANDISTPNPAYFARVDQMVAAAANHNIVLFFDTLETGGWMAKLLLGGTAKAYSYGRFLGNRYKNSKNII